MKLIQFLVLMIPYNLYALEFSGDSVIDENGFDYGISSTPSDIDSEQEVRRTDEQETISGPDQIVIEEEQRVPSIPRTVSTREIAIEVPEEAEDAPRGVPFLHLTPPLESSASSANTEISAEEEERMTQLMLNVYFSSRPDSQRIINPILRQQLRTAHSNPHLIDRNAIPALRRMITHSDLTHSAEEEFALQSIVFNATNHAISQLQSESSEHERLAQARWTKKKSTVLAASCAIISSSVTSAMALLVYFVTREGA